LADFIKEMNIQDEEIAKRVLSLQREAYKIEADLIGSMEIPPLKESLQELMDCEEKHKIVTFYPRKAGRTRFRLTFPNRFCHLKP
jgi:hypothetical protein